MCRLLSIVGGFQNITAEKLLGEFKKLAEFGNIPPHTPKGHKDGWGLIFYPKNKLPKLFIESRDAYTSAGYDFAIRKISSAEYSVLIGHLRKASVGTKSLKNTQPFIKKGCALAHNGTIFDSKKIILKPSFAKLLKGDTDSERFFVLILQTFFNSKKKSLKQALINTVKFVQKNLDYTSLNLILSDGKTVFALREINMSNAYVRAEKLLDYYSLFVGADGNIGMVISSEKLTNKLKWEPLKNHELIEVRVAGNRVRKFRI